MKIVLDALIKYKSIMACCVKLTFRNEKEVVPYYTCNLFLAYQPAGIAINNSYPLPYLAFGGAQFTFTFSFQPITK